MSNYTGERAEAGQIATWMSPIAGDDLAMFVMRALGALELQARRALDLEALVSHVIPSEQAGEAFRLLDEHPEEALQVVLGF